MSKKYSFESYADAAAAVERICEIYEDMTERIRRRFQRYLEGQRAGASVKDACYPELRMSVGHHALVYDSRPSWGTLPYPGRYAATLTQPALFRDYYRAQLGRLADYHGVPFEVGVSNRPIPLPFVVEEATADLQPEDIRALQAVFAMPELAAIEDAIANGTFRPAAGQPRPLSLFTAERVDFAIQRLHHYTGTHARHFQRFVLFTNYQRYVDAFIAHGRDIIAKSGGEDAYQSFVEPGDVVSDVGSGNRNLDARHPSQQMPAYHLTRRDRLGITLVNIGVGPSNAKTITDHLAVLRPHCWLMIGHCGGLRRSQQLGDYVLAHAYQREDHVLDHDLPVSVPVPPIAEIQVALQDAVSRITGLGGQDLKSRMRTGTVVTTDDRNWELRSNELYSQFNRSRAIAIDMESATIAANGFRLRVPYGTLLCVSDKPIHGEIKLRGMADSFYRQRIDQHLTIGLETIRILRDRGVNQLHSRKLRAFDEPPFQ
ncbi:MAG: AMP nucleosidase [Rhodomicrobiaceae bacterium]